MSHLFSPLQIKGINLKNRIVVSPMCQYSSVDGFANDWHLVHLGTWAVGGASLIIVEATAVSPEGGISPQDLGLWKKEHIDKLFQITSFLKQQGSVPGIQLAHAGRKASTEVPWVGRNRIEIQNGGWQTVAPSAIPFSKNYPHPAALDKPGLAKVVSDFQASAEMAIQAGFQVIEIHASHGYLLHQFLSPLSNVREDEYGGRIQNRMRLLLEVIEAVQKVLPAEIPLFVRVPGTDWTEGGWTPEDAVTLARELKEKGVDLLDVTSGGLSEQQKIPNHPGYQMPFSAKIRKETGIMTSTVGLITKAEHAEQILANGEADLVMFARELLRNPYFPLHAATELGAQLKWPDQYLRAK